MGVIEEHENINSIDLLLVNVFLVKKKLSFSIKMMQIDMVLQFEKVVLRKKKLVRCDFFCHRQGKQPLKIMDPSKEQWNRKSLKCGCKAHLSIILRKSFDIFPREWHVTKFFVDHNYYFFSPLEVRFLLANRVITIDDEKHILFLKEVGFSIREVMCVMELKKHLKHGQLPFFQRDIRNLYVKWGGRMQRMMSWIS